LLSEAPDPGRHHVGTPGDIISECPGDFVGIRIGEVIRARSSSRRRLRLDSEAALALLIRTHSIVGDDPLRPHCDRIPPSDTTAPALGNVQEIEAQRFGCSKKSRTLSGSGRSFTGASAGNHLPEGNS
jgi:hypothetical protein